MSEPDRGPASGSSGGRIRWILAALTFTLGTSLTVAFGVLVLFFVTVHGDQFVGSERLRSLLALVLFVALISVPAYVLAIDDPFRRFR